jgi:hypothetical protein
MQQFCYECTTTLIPQDISTSYMSFYNYFLQSYDQMKSSGNTRKHKYGMSQPCSTFPKVVKEFQLIFHYNYAYLSVEGRTQTQRQCPAFGPQV